MEHMKLIFFAVVFVLSFLGTGCVHDEANRYYLKEQLPTKQAQEVQILQEAPQQPYTVIADLQAGRTYFLFFEWGTSPKYMQKRAAEIGADAVIIVSAGGDYSRSEVWAGKDRFANSQSRILGTAIKYNK